MAKTWENKDVVDHLKYTLKTEYLQEVARNPCKLNKRIETKAQECVA